MWVVALGSVVEAVAGPAVQPPGLHTTQVEAPKFDVDPHLPPSRCLVRVEVDERGAPASTQARACPPKFAAMAEEAVKRWRWAPPEVDGRAARALTVVAVDFTGKGRIPVAPAERCAYSLRVTSDGRVAPAGTVAPQCAIWPAASVAGGVPAAGACTLSLDADDATGWVFGADCDEEALEVAAALVGDSLFVEGTGSTRLVIELPAPGTAPEASAVEVRGPATAAPAAGGRIGGGSSAERELDQKMDAPEGTVAPIVDLEDLLKEKKAQPAPEPEPETE